MHSFSQLRNGQQAIFEWGKTLRQKPQEEGHPPLPKVTLNFYGVAKLIHKYKDIIIMAVLGNTPPYQSEA